jgi:hypothetical protein
MSDEEENSVEKEDDVVVVSGHGSYVVTTFGR